MSTINIVAAVDEAMGIGRTNQLLCHLPADLQHFRALTMGKPVIMGRRTFESIGRPLPGRQNLVLTRSNWNAPGVTTVASIAEGIEKVSGEPNIMIIGGAGVFAEAIEFADSLYITYIEHRFDADVFFPPIRPEIWQCVSREERLADEKNPYRLAFCRYERKKISA
ncbi:dihydrofolate reductase FolA [Legionella geestiana]|uniref:Dihydrofolate reductase n=1 Tax=Legionella geestiana TaxID=45065 RepID=A0A0W0TTT4_9GAMM|nr:dihydrofolate reductase [Legionella geestiana]KTC99074.1 dihydrofolate reductase FolA [Legionella geestiana]QBS12588.1 dihydrofolate reductase [Legionella geestiana]QDQ39696.1 dihydrofolate reductase [Legionella geestiana]STX54958.1 dihydrofolate reductase FolA [Legionella geestiana]